MGIVNLLPQDSKRIIRAARNNVSLVKIILCLGFGVLFLIFVCGGLYLYLNQSKKNVERSSSTNSAVTVNSASAEAETKANSIKASLQSAKTLLDAQVSYADIMTSLAAVMPSGSVVDKLSLNNDTFGKNITIAARVKSPDTITEMKSNIEKTKLFSNFTSDKIESVQSGATGYPFSVMISLTINKVASK